MQTENINNEIQIKKIVIDKTVLENISGGDVELDVLLLSKTKLDTAVNIIFDTLDIGLHSAEDETDETYLKRKLIEIYKKRENELKKLQDIVIEQKKEIDKLKKSD